MESKVPLPQGRPGECKGRPPGRGGGEQQDEQPWLLGADDLHEEEPQRGGHAALGASRRGHEHGLLDYLLVKLAILPS